MAQFDFKKKQDKYIVTNQENNAVTYEVKKLYDCVNFITISDGTIPGVLVVGPVGQGTTNERIFDFTEDGEYQIIIDGTDTINIKHYNNLLTSIIEGVVDNICDCKCGCECSDGEDPLCSLLMLRAKIDVYKRLTNPQGVAYFDAVYQHTKCLIEKPLHCVVDREMILGQSECDVELVKQLIALDYLAIYFFELSQACLTEDIKYVRDKFNTETVFCCIQSLGIDVGDIETLINNRNMGTFTINSGAYVNQPPSAVGDYSITVANRATTTLTLAMFTSLTTPAYSDPEGDAPQAVRIDTLPADGTLRLGLNLVTAGQVILVADINAGNLTYSSPNQDALDGDSFDFSVSDAGSGLFVS